MLYLFNIKTNRLLQRCFFLFYCFNLSFNLIAQLEYTNESVLAVGDFYKISVEATGICKIDKAFLSSLDVDTDNAPLDQLRVYGNGGSMLPERSGNTIHDDLVENSIKVVDQNGNNRMDDGDYALFYAESPNQWTFANNNYHFQRHYYSNTNHYFISFDKGSGKRINTESASGSADINIDYFDALRNYEENVFNPLESGREWFGATMVPGNTFSTDFNFPNIVPNSEIEVRLACVGSRSEQFNRFSIYANNSLIDELTKITSTFELEAELDVAAYGELKTSVNTIPATENVNLRFDFASNSSSARGHIDFVDLIAKSHIDFSGAMLSNGYLIIRNKDLFEQSGNIRYEISNYSNDIEIWEIEGNGNISRKEINTMGGSTHFISNKSANEMAKFIAFNESKFVEAQFVEKIVNQNLHATNFPDFVIVSHAEFMEAANELADFHRAEDNMDVLVVDIEQVYNEFSSGNADLSAIRNLMKMFYDRAKALEDDSKLPENLLLLGDASFDYKNIFVQAENNSNYIPTYESKESLLAQSSFCTDDYFAFLDDHEGATIVNTATIDLDIGVGRFPVSTDQQAMDMVDKIKHYKSLESKEAWLNTLTFISDDGNGNLHFNDAEAHANNMSNKVPVYNISKIHCDAYPQISTSGGSTYPAVTTAINNQMFTGSFIMNFAGHGGENGWTDERILTSDIIRSWKNKDKLPLFITATCSFTRYDRPESVSAGEWLVLNPEGGAIALMTTVRVVYASSNEVLNANFLNAAFDFSDGVKTLGEIAQQCKNNIPHSDNSRKFVLMGDPALTLNYPEMNIETDQIINQSLGEESDTIRALEQITISGKITDRSGNIIPNFNGTLTPVVYDKSEILTTLGNNLPDGWDGEGDCPESNQKEASCPADFELRKSIIFKGNTSVENGLFEFSFIVPKDIAYNFGEGKISYFAVDENGIMANGFDDNLIIGGISDNAPDDDTGPEVNVYLNDQSFVYGGMVNESPLLLIELEDEQGINTAGRGIGHDLTALLNDDQRNMLILNNYYEAALNNFQKGTVSYPLENLPEGRHTVNVKAWDILNNSGEGYTEFVVAESEDFALEHVLNYPNPFSDNTAFWFEHNRVGDVLDVRVQIFTISGRLVKTISTQIPAAQTRVSDINWNGLDDFGNKLGRGAYVYQLSVKTSNGQQAHKIEKLVILK